MSRKISIYPRRAVIMAVFLSFVILLILQGCSSFSSGGNAPISDIVIHKGTKGIEIDFIRGSPPKEVQEHEDFTVAIEIENKGAYDVSSGIINLNYEEDYIEFENFHPAEYITESIDKKIRFDMEGKSILNEEGQSDILIAKLRARELDDQSQYHESLISFTTCYKYKTYFSDEVCIDTEKNYEDPDAEDVCNTKEKTYSGQGAPVAVTKLEPIIYYDSNGILKPSFTIYVDNKGNGNIIKENSIQKACSSATQSKDEFNIVTIKNVKLGQIKLKCVPEQIKIVERLGSNYARCTPEEDIMGSPRSYLSIISLELDYGYMESISKEVGIVDGGPDK